MANLLSQDIGLNYKGLINIGSTINQNISASLQSLTDGDGNLLPLEISTTQMSVGGATGTGRLIVRGDGTNPIFRFENSTGTETFGLSSTGQVLTFNSNTTSTTLIVQSTHYPSIRIVGYGTFVIGTNALSGTPLGVTNLLGNITYASFGNTYGTEHYSFGAFMPFSASSGSNTFNTLLLRSTINQTGGANGVTRGLYIEPTLTSAADFRAIEVKVGSTSAHKLLYLTNAANERVLEINAAKEIGFFGSSPSAQLDVSGSRSNPEEALANLLTALATYGIIVDATTA